jgi:hypothetical protein
MYDDAIGVYGGGLEVTGWFSGEECYGREPCGGVGECKGYFRRILAGLKGMTGIGAPVTSLSVEGDDDKSLRGYLGGVVFPEDGRFMPCPFICREELFRSLAIEEPVIAAIDGDVLIGGIVEEEFDAGGEFRGRWAAPLHNGGDLMRSDCDANDLLCAGVCRSGD